MSTLSDKYIKNPFSNHLQEPPPLTLTLRITGRRGAARGGNRKRAKRACGPVDAAVSRCACGLDVGEHARLGGSPLRCLADELLQNQHIEVVPQDAVAFLLD